MSLAITREQEQLRETVRRYLRERVPLERVRELMDTTEVFDVDLWKHLAQDLGIHSLAIPEEYDGAGAGYQELAYVFEECGAALLPAPLLATLGLAAPALMASGDEDAKREYLPQIASGELVATVAWVSPGGTWKLSDNRVVAEGDGDSVKLTGELAPVLDGLTAGLILVLAKHGDGYSVFAVDGSADGVRREAMPQLDQTRPQARVVLESAPAKLVGKAGDGERVLSETIDHASMLLSAEMVGGTQACLDMSVEYAKIREQFGRVIGSFQAIKHKCAETLVALEGARAAAYYAAWAATESPSELPIVAPLAKSVAAEAYFRAAGENIQIHGGIGFTWEHNAHLYFKRAQGSKLMWGDVEAYRRELADRLGW